MIKWLAQKSKSLLKFISKNFEGWHNLDADVRIMIGTGDNRSLIAFLLGPTSPLYTALLFTSVPAFLVVRFFFFYLFFGLFLSKNLNRIEECLISKEF